MRKWSQTGWNAKSLWHLIGTKRVRGMNHSCQNCLYYRESSGPVGGVCQRHAPKPVAVDDSRRESRDSWAYWPRVRGNNSCGDWQPEDWLGWQDNWSDCSEILGNIHNEIMWWTDFTGRISILACFRKTCLDCSWGSILWETETLAASINRDGECARFCSSNINCGGGSRNQTLLLYRLVPSDLHNYAEFLAMVRTQPLSGVILHPSLRRTTSACYILSMSLVWQTSHPFLLS